MSTIELEGSMATENLEHPTAELENEILSLAEENESLRIYLARVLEMLDARIAETTVSHEATFVLDAGEPDIADQAECVESLHPVDAVTTSAQVETTPVVEPPAATDEDLAQETLPAERGSRRMSEAVQPVRMADLERRLRRAEETIEDLLWILSRFDVPGSGSDH